MNCFNGSKYLKEALNSVLNQSYRNWEIIFWDNNSTDESNKIVKSIKDERIKYFKSEEKTDLGTARANAYKYVKGDILTFLDVDDIWFIDKLKYNIDSFSKNNNLSLVYSNTVFFNHKSTKALYSEKMPQGKITDQLLTRYFLSLESVALKIDAIKSMNYAFDKEFSHISDFDLITRVSTTGEAEYIDKKLTGWRIHENNESFINNHLFLNERIKWYKKNQKNMIFKHNSNAIHEFYLNNISEIYMKNNFRINRNIVKDLKNHRFINIKNKIKFIISSLPFSSLIYTLSKYFMNKFL
tara:strand:+ start:359 stop:1249 length:891 start_codon:yes stop_codon:yes gene_type:complete